MLTLPLQLNALRMRPTDMSPMRVSIHLVIKSLGQNGTLPIAPLEQERVGNTLFLVQKTYKNIQIKFMQAAEFVWLVAASH
jgi:hypothetical protein